MSRNNALAALLHAITSPLSKQWIGLVICGILFLLFLQEAYGEQVFFARCLKEITNEFRSMEATQKKSG